MALLKHIEFAGDSAVIVLQQLNEWRLQSLHLTYNMQWVRYGDKERLGYSYMLVVDYRED